VFHRVPFFSAEVKDAVERIPTGFVSTATGICASNAAFLIW